MINIVVGMAVFNKVGDQIVGSMAKVVVTFVFVLDEAIRNLSSIIFVKAFETDVILNEIRDIVTFFDGIRHYYENVILRGVDDYFVLDNVFTHIHVPNFYLVS